jgi:hypothetical protein
MRLRDVVRFQKALAVAAVASNPFEAAAVEAAARRLVESGLIDPTHVPDQSFVAQIKFNDNALLKTLRDEYRAAHPLPVKKKKEPKVSSAGVSSTSGISFEIDLEKFRNVIAQNKKRVNTTVRSAKEAKPINPTPRVNTTTTKSEAERVNTTKKPRSADRHKEPNRDRHREGYMRDYMRRRRAVGGP